MEFTSRNLSRPARRRHEILAHTADVGIRAQGPDLEATFEEAAAALAELSADRDDGATPGASHPVSLQAGDLVALAFAWLNELIGLVDTRGALARAQVDDIAEAPSHWLLRGTVTLAQWDGRAARRRLDLKSATYHRLAVERIRGGWSLTAYLDV